MKKMILLLVCALLVSGCTRLKLATANTTTLTFDGQIIEDQAYGPLKRQSLDIYVPESANTSPAPVVIFFHGGRWTFGSKGQYQFVGTKLASMGYVAVLPNTRLYPDVKFPTFIEDAAQAVAWVQANIDQYGGNQEVFISGHSSGAHIGALVVANRKYLQDAGGNPDTISGFIGMSGPYDFTPKADDLVEIFGPEDQFSEMVVSHYIDGDEPPFALMYALNDDKVHIRNLKRLKARIMEKGGDVETYLYKDGGHAGTVAALSWANPDELPVAEDMQKFIERHRRQTPTED